ncbi:MAG: hypothetical protein RLZZ200_1137 [Pseudomonadota bacterium]|jgi:uncharacterized protein YciI
MSRLFLLRFTDKPDSMAIRQRHLAEHVAWLDAHADEVIVAGTLRVAQEDPPLAAIWIVRADSAEAVLALSDGDPFWVHGLRATREVFLYRAHSAIPVLNAD